MFVLVLALGLLAVSCESNPSFKPKESVNLQPEKSVPIQPMIVRQNEISLQKSMDFSEVLGDNLSLVGDKEFFRDKKTGKTYQAYVAPTFVVFYEIKPVLVREMKFDMIFANKVSEKNLLTIGDEQLRDWSLSVTPAGGDESVDTIMLEPSQVQKATCTFFHGFKSDFPLTISIRGMAGAVYIDCFIQLELPSSPLGILRNQETRLVDIYTASEASKLKFGIRFYGNNPLEYKCLLDDKTPIADIVRENENSDRFIFNVGKHLDLKLEEHTLKFYETDDQTKEPVDTYVFKVAIIKPEQIRINPLGEGKDKNRFAVAGYGCGSVMFEIFNDSDFSIPVEVSDDESYEERHVFVLSTALIAPRSTGYVDIHLNRHCLEFFDGYSKPLQVRLDFGGVTKEKTVIVFSCPGIDTRVKPAVKSDDLYPHVMLAKSDRPRAFSQIMAFDQSGNILWKDERPMLSDILVSGDKAIAQYRMNNLVCYNRSSGKVVWELKEIEYVIEYQKMFVENGVLCLFGQYGSINDRIKNLLCFDLQTGKRLDPKTVKVNPCDLRIGEIEVYYGYDNVSSYYISAWIGGKEAWSKKLGCYTNQDCVYVIDSVFQNGNDVELAISSTCLGDQGFTNSLFTLGLNARTGATEWCVSFKSNYSIDGNSNRPIEPEN